jgi:multiple sugar transport system ATP-binding protein
LTLADRIAVLRYGHIVQIGTPQDIYDRPASVFVAQLVGAPRINLLPAERHNGQIEITNSALHLATPSPLAALPASFTLGIRPEDVQPAAEGAFGGEISLVEPLGVETILHIQSGRQTLLSLVSGMTHWRIGETMRFNVVTEHLHFFDGEGTRVG